MANLMSLLGSVVDTVDLNLTNFDQSGGQSSDSILAGIGNSLGLRNGYNPKSKKKTNYNYGVNLYDPLRNATFNSSSGSMANSGNSVVVTDANGKQRRYDIVKHSTVEKWARKSKGNKNVRRNRRKSSSFVTKSELQLILGALGK